MILLTVLLKALASSRTQEVTDGLQMEIHKGETDIHALLVRSNTGQVI